MDFVLYIWFRSYSFYQGTCEGGSSEFMTKLTDIATHLHPHMEGMGRRNSRNETMRNQSAIIKFHMSNIWVGMVASHACFLG